MLVPGDGSQFEGYPLPSPKLLHLSLCASMFLGYSEGALFNHDTATLKTGWFSMHSRAGKGMSWS
jgi:hypothetical protein